MSLNPCVKCKKLPTITHNNIGDSVSVCCDCCCLKLPVYLDIVHIWNESNPLPANFQQVCRDSGYLVRIEELKRQLDASESVARGYRKEWQSAEEKRNLIMSAYKEAKRQLENKGRKIERQRSELERLNERLTIKCEKIAAMADVIKARDEKIASLEKLLKTQGEVFSENDVATWKFMAEVRRAVREWDRCVEATERA